MVAVEDSGRPLLKIENVKAYGCTMAGAWRTHPVERLPIRLQLCVVIEIDVVNLNIGPYTL